MKYYAAVCTNGNSFYKVITVFVYICESLKYRLHFLHIPIQIFQCVWTSVGYILRLMQNENR